MENILGSPLFFVVLGEGVIILLLFGVVLYQCCAAHGRRKTQRRMYGHAPDEGEFNSKGTPDDPFARYTAGRRPIGLHDPDARSTASTRTARSSGSRPAVMTMQVRPQELKRLDRPGNISSNDLSHRARSSDTSSVATSALAASGHGQIATPSAVHLRPRAPTPLSASSISNAYAEEDERERTIEGAGGEYADEGPAHDVVTSDSRTPRPILDTGFPQNSSSSSLRQLLNAAQHGGNAPVYPFLLRSNVSSSDAHSTESAPPAGPGATGRLRRHGTFQGDPEQEQIRARRSSRILRGSPTRSLSAGVRPAGRIAGVGRLDDSDGIGTGPHTASYFED